ncbi:ABC-ATPase domain-containing protein [Thermodesulfatator autotrophicus]|uniref:ATPase n=1 Tax=Thermodesulfatator autotrophicus TaxID=1795632 RepID=A0A177EAL9_9BACT|nr:ATPase [Thermodesulfatator autotrophicus]
MDLKDLETKLKRIDGKGYGAYKELAGVYRFAEGELFIDKVQSDPFAPPSLLRLKISGDIAQIPSHFYSSFSRRIGLENYLAYQAARMAQNFSRKIGTGKGGIIKVHGPGQEILPRTALEVSQNGSLELRFFVGLPAAGRRILAKEARKILLDYLPKLAKALCYSHLDKTLLKAFVETNEDADLLRSKLKDLGLIGFVADGSILPRASGVDPRPASKAIPFKAPDSLAIEVELPNRGRIRGLGIRPGVTLIAGGGFHGKSTLLRALELGIYNHVPGDGRELVVTSPLAVKIRAEDGRKITGVDISPFINNLPLGIDTRSFTTDCASGSTSQAANIMEALELSADVLLIDEDTSATNFMIRDRRMQMLVSKEKEPITPFIDRVRELYENFGVSSIIVVGGCGDYLDVADTVIVMDNYLPQDATIRAREIIKNYPSNRLKEVQNPFKKPEPRRFAPQSFPKTPKKPPKAKARDNILWGKEIIDLSAVEQLVCVDQTRAMALALPLLAEKLKEGKNLVEGVSYIKTFIEEKGLKSLSPLPRGDLAFFRTIELATALNRLRSLKV